MIELILINQIIVILIVAIGLWFGFWALFANRKAKSNQLFFLTTVCISLWAIFAHLGFTVPIPEMERSIMWFRLNFGAVALCLLTAYYFSIYFPKKITENRFLNKIMIFLGITTCLLSVFTDLIIKDVVLKPWGRDIVFGQGQSLFYIVSIIFLFIILYNLFKKYLISTKEEKLKLKYILVGASIFALMNTIFNIIFPIWRGTTEYWQFGSFSSIFFLGFTSYAIVKQKLFEIKVILTQLLVGVMGIVLFILPFLVPIPWLRVLLFAIFFLFCIVGYLLIKHSLREARQKETLEQKVQERTKELKGAKDIAEKRAAKLERWYKVTVGRELRMVELKKEIKELEEKIRKKRLQEGVKGDRN